MNCVEQISDMFILYSHICVTYGINFIIHSMYIITAGLILQYVMRKKSAAYQSLFLRFILVAVLLSPLVSLICDLQNFSGMKLPEAVSSESENETLPQETSGLLTRRDHASSENDKTQNSDNELNPALPIQLSSGLSHITSSSNKSPHNDPVTKEHFFNYTCQTRARWLTGKWLPLLYILFVIIWFVLSLCFFIKTVMSYYMVFEIRHTATIANPGLIRICSEAAQELGIAPPGVYQSAMVNNVFLAGLRKPVIILPLDIQNDIYGTKEIFIHELAHLVRHDNLWNYLCNLGRILLPFHPLIKVLVRKINTINDYACDDYVLMYRNIPQKYAENIYQIADLCQSTVSDAVAGIVSGNRTLVDRIRRILDTKIARELKIRKLDIIPVVFLFSFILAVTGFAGLRTGNHEKNTVMSGARTIPLTMTIKPNQLTTISNTGYQISFQESGPDIEAAEKLELSGISANDDVVTNASPGFTGLIVYEKIVESLPTENVTEFQTPGRGIDHFSTVANTAFSSRKMEYLPAGNILESAAAPDNTLPLYFRPESVITPAFRNDRAISAPAALEIIVPSEIKNTGLTDQERKKLSDLYSSVRKDKLYPVWSPDSERIAFNDRDFGIWIVDAVGGEPTLVYDNYMKLVYNRFNIHYGDLATLDFSPDGSEIAFRRYTIDTAWGTLVRLEEVPDPFDYEITNPKPVIECVRIATGESRIIAEGALTGCWSESGRYFAYISVDADSRRGLLIKDLENGSVRRIDCAYPVSVRFSHDDSLLFVTEKDSENNVSIAAYSTLTGSRELNDRIDNAAVCDVSPDGLWMLCADTGIYSRHYLYNTESGVIESIPGSETPGTAWGRFSPDGSKICMNLKDENNGGECWNIYTCDIHAVKRSAESAVSPKPEAFSLSGNYPNPFNMSTTIRFSLGKAGHVSLIIYNSMGQKVRELVSEFLEPGAQNAVWDGLDGNGMKVSTGMYIAKLTASNHMLTHKMMVVK